MITEVPCGDCFLCCTKGGIKLEPADYDQNGEPRFIVMPEMINDKHELGHRNGVCVYLHEGKCAIHNDKPIVCRNFDCRKLAIIFSKQQIIDLDTKGYHAMEYWEHGKELILAGVQHG